MAHVPISVGVPNDASFTRVVAALRANGMSVEGELDGLGIVTGSVDEAGLETLRGIDGVGIVEVRRDIRAASRNGPFIWF